MKLTAIAVKKAAPGRHGDGNNLYLLVKEDGRKYWVFRYRDRLTGKLKDKGLGPAHEVSLATARTLAQLHRADLRAGKDPIEARRHALQEARVTRAKLVSFGECAARCIAAIEAEWRNEKHKAQWTATIDTYCGALKPLPVSAIDVGLVHKTLAPIWSSKTETAARLRSRIERILDWATAHNYRTGENPARWRGNLKSLLPSPAKIKDVKHRAALPHSEVAELMMELAKRKDLSATALQLQILTATRPSEAVEAKWSEFDLKNRSWTIPKERMKAGRAHKIPLAPQVVTLLEGLPKLDSRHLFPGKVGHSLTTAAPLKLLKGVRPGMTCHGFRSSFRDWSAESSVHSREAAELALAHSIKDKTESAYFRSEMYDKRIPLMEDWAKYCCALIE